MFHHYSRELYPMPKGAAVLLAATVMIASPSLSRAEDNTNARMIIDKAIQSMGGKEKLARYQAQTWKEKATYFGPGSSEQYEATYAARWPDKLKVDIQREFTLVVNGATGWVRTESNTRELSKEEWEEHKEGTYCVWIMSLLPLKNPAFNLKVLGEKEVSSRPTVAVKVSSKGHFDVILYFDKGTGLLVRSDIHFKEAKTGKDINQTTILSDYKEEDATRINSPTHASITRDGKRCVEADLEYKHLETLDEHIFAKP